MSLSIDLAGRVAVVTGGGRGIGRAVGETLCRAGADVVLLARGREALEEASRVIGEAGGRCTFRTADVTDAGAVQETFREIVREAGRLDILVNNAGITRDNIVLRMRKEEWETVLEVNLHGAFHCIQAAARTMLKARSGKIVNLVSVSAFHGNPGQANYAASKAGVVALTKSCAKEFAPRGVQVNAVAPGLIRTEMTRQMPEDARNALLGAVPCGRLGTTREVAGAVLFLVSPLADYVTGEVLAVDGGLAM